MYQKHRVKGHDARCERSYGWAGHASRFNDIIIKAVMTGGINGKIPGHGRTDAVKTGLVNVHMRGTGDRE